MTDGITSPEAGGLTAGEPARPGHARRPGVMHTISRAWLGFRAWRRGRPYWAGLLLIIAGAELLLIPLPIHSMGVILHIGIGGISGILIGAVQIALGLLLWFTAGQRVFYSIVAVLLSVAALVASNLGGFLLGTILGIIGGSLAFGWAPLPPGAAPRGVFRRAQNSPDDTLTDLGLHPAGDEAAVTAAAGTGPEPAFAEPEAARAGDGYEDDDYQADGHQGDRYEEAPAWQDTAVTGAAQGEAQAAWSRLDPNWGAAGSPDAVRYGEPDPRAARYRRTAPLHRGRTARGHTARGTIISGSIVAALVSALTGGAVSPTSSPAAADPSVAAASPSPSASGAGASPSPAASPDPTTSTSPGASASPSATPAASPSAGPSSSPAPAASPSPSPTPTPTASVPPFAIASTPSTLTASSVTLAGFAYDGVVNVPTSAGTVSMMEFSASSIDLAAPKLAVKHGDGTITTTASTLNFSGNVVLYATQLSGDVLGVPVTITPDNAEATILQILGQLGLTQDVTQVFPLTMTSVTTQQPFTSADDMAVTGLSIS